MAASASARLACQDMPRDCPAFPLSSGERAGVRGNRTSDRRRLPNYQDSVANAPAFAIIRRTRPGVNWRSLALLALALLAPGLARGQTNPNPITRQVVVDAEKLLGLDFSDAKIDMMLPDLKEQLGRFEALHRFAFSNDVPPALLFNPIPVGMKFETHRRKFKLSPPGKVELPANLDELAFYSVGELAALIKTRQITSERLTRFYLARLKKYGPKLECVVTLTEDLALQQAKRADAEIAAGKYRGPLHGIPYGAKDLLAVKGIRTTWGAAPYTNQVFDYDATVIKRLEQAGAVLVANGRCLVWRHDAQPVEFEAGFGRLFGRVRRGHCGGPHRFRHWHGNVWFHCGTV